MHLDAAGRVRISRRRTKLGASRLLQTTSVTVHSPFISDHLVYLLYMGLLLFCLQTPRWHTHPIKTLDKKMNNRSNNFSGSHMYDLWVKWLLVKSARMNFRIRDRTSVTVTIWKIYHPWQAWYLRNRLERKTETMTNNTVTNLSIIIPTYIKWAQPKS